MANNSSSNDSCPHLDWYRKASGQIGIGVYYVFTPFYFTLGVLAHILSLKAFLKRASKEKAFIYQVMESASKLCAIISRTIYVVTTNWLTGRNIIGVGGDWWFACYACIWFTAIIPTATMNVFFTTSELLSIFVIYNRVLAIVKPFLYKNANHKRNQIIVAVFSFGIGFLTTAYHYPNYKVVNSGVLLYNYAPDKVYQNTLTFVILNQTRNVVRGISIVALYAGNVALVCLFRKHQKQKIHLLNRDADAKDKDETETTLTVLCLCQSLFMTISGTAIICYYGVQAMSRSFGTCEGVLLTPMLDGIVALTDICDFYLACLINRSFRKMIFNIPMFNRFVSTVTPHVT